MNIFEYHSDFAEMLEYRMYSAPIYTVVYSVQYCVFIDTMRTFAAVMIFERSIRISRRQALAYAPTSPGFYTFPCKTLFFVAHSLSFFQLFLPLNAKRN